MKNKKISKKEKIKKLQSIKLDLILKQIATYENMTGKEESEDFSKINNELIVLLNK